MAFLTTKSAAAFDAAAQIRAVMARGGPGGLRQLWQIRRLLRDPGEFRVEEYYEYGFWRREVTPVQRAEFLSLRRNRPFNDRLRARTVPQDDAVIEDKLATAARLSAAGLPVVPTLAFYASDPAAEPAQPVPVLRDRAALLAFLGDPAAVPLFGKPLNASVGRGVVAIAATDPGADRATLTNGADVPLSALIDEIAAGYPGGYLLQPLQRNHAVLRPHLGSATASLRLVTVRDGPGAALLYAKQKLPALGELHDGPSRRPRGGCWLDQTTGEVLSLRVRFDPAGPALAHWADGSQPLKGVHLPHYAEAVAAVRQGHLLFPGHGILGWDVFLTDTGPVISEVNANPNHASYQQVTFRGLLNPDLMPLIRRAEAWAAAA